MTMMFTPQGSIIHLDSKLNQLEFGGRRLKVTVTSQGEVLFC